MGRWDRLFVAHGLIHAASLRALYTMDGIMAWDVSRLHMWTISHGSKTRRMQMQTDSGELARPRRIQDKAGDSPETRPTHHAKQ